MNKNGQLFLYEEILSNDQATGDPVIDECLKKMAVLKKGSP